MKGDSTIQSSDQTSGYSDMAWACAGVWGRARTRWAHLHLASAMWTCVVFCYWTSLLLLITNTTFEHTGVHQCTWPHCRLEDDDRPCHCFSWSAISLGHSGKRSTVGEEAGQTWQTQAEYYQSTLMGTGRPSTPQVFPGGKNLNLARVRWGHGEGLKNIWQTLQHLREGSRA